MPVRLLEIDVILEVLQGGPARIELVASELSDDHLSLRPSAGEWSPNEILAHLRACQDVWGDARIGAMLDHDHPTIRAVNPRTWLERTDYRSLPFHRSLTAFGSQRERFVARLAELTVDEWSRDGTFTGGGKPRHYSVHTEADALARHERSHIKQIERLCRAL